MAMQPRHLIALYEDGLFRREEVYHRLLLGLGPATLGPTHEALMSQGWLTDFLRFSRSLQLGPDGSRALATLKSAAGV